MINGRYYFKDNLPSNKIAQGLSSISSLSIRDQIMVWHYRLGHPSFSYLKHLFPMLFQKVDPLSFQCEVVYWQRANEKLTFQNPTMHQNHFIFFIRFLGYKSLGYGKEY